jgi:molybdopterin converting factor small subunit
MKVTVLVFASYAEALGRESLDVELPVGSTVAACVEAVRRLTGDRVPPGPLVAINRRYAKGEQPLADGDEVALIPPVAGG